MLEEIRERLEEEADRLLHELNVELPAEIERAAGLGDLRENSEYSAALERQQFVRARLDYISRRLAELTQLNLEEIPTDRVGFGSRVTVRDTASGEEALYVLAFGDDLDFDSAEISMRSPIGRALLGRARGDVISVRLPSRRVEYEILDFVTVHEIARDGRPEEDSPGADGTGGGGS